jgi:hypothetical protein
MTIAEIRNEFGHLWTTEANQYVLIKNSQFLLGYIIVNKENRLMLIIEDNAAGEYVLAQMLEHGCTVVTDVLEIPRLSGLTGDDRA